MDKVNKFGGAKRDLSKEIATEAAAPKLTGAPSHKKNLEKFGRPLNLNGVFDNQKKLQGFLDGLKNLDSEIPKSESKFKAKKTELQQKTVREKTNTISMQSRTKKFAKVA